MKVISLILLLSISIPLFAQQKTQNYLRDTKPDTAYSTNDFYDNAETYELELSKLYIGGEIDNSAYVNFSEIPLRTVIVKETHISDDGNKFIGAYRYDGYALYDILNHVKLHKVNYDEFPRIIDMYVQVENDKGEKVIISWGEIFYPNHLQEIIIATRVMRIVPSKTNDLWEIPMKAKLIIPSDLITERNISDPTKITVKSYPKSFETTKGMDPLYSPILDLYTENNLVETLESYPEETNRHEYNTIFYGRGRGIHSTLPFNGILLKDILTKYISVQKKDLREGIILVVAADGYRVVFSLSEIMNRNDQSEILLLYRPEAKTNGVFRLFPACDFFSDRAVKGIKAIYYSTEEE